MAQDTVFLARSSLIANLATREQIHQRKEQGAWVPTHVPGCLQEPHSYLEDCALSLGRTREKRTPMLTRNDAASAKQHDDYSLRYPPGRNYWRSVSSSIFWVTSYWPKLKATVYAIGRKVLGYNSLFGE